MRQIVLVAAVLCLWSSVAQSKTVQDQIVGRSAECIVEQGVGVFDVPLNPRVVTALSFPGKLARGMLQGDPPRGFKLHRTDNALFIWPRGDRLDATANFVVTIDDPFMHVVLFVHVTDDPDKALKACRFVARDAKKAEQQRLNARLEQKTAEIRAHANAEIEQQTDNIRDQAEAETLDWKRMQQRIQARDRLFADGELRSSVRAVTGDLGKVDLEIGRGVWIDGEFWTAFWLHNRGWRPYRLAHVQVTTANGSLVPIDDIELDAPARPREASIAEVPSGKRVAGFMRIPDVAVGSGPKAITFRGFSGRELLWATAEEPVWFYVPKRKEEIEEEQRREAELRAARGVVTLSVQGTYGAIWLGDGTGADLSDTTSLKGLGVRATYGISPMLAVEAEVMGGSTGSARFADVTYQGAQGDLARSAWLGRAQIGGVLRLGKGTYVPIARLGFGGQGGRHSATFNGTEEPDLPFEFSALWYGGAGLDVRPGDHFLVGFALTIETPVSSDYELSRRTVEAGIYLGYSWRP